jgi:hypothetical protein
MRAVILLKAFRAHDATNNFREKVSHALLALAGCSTFRLRQARAASWSGIVSGKTNSASQPYYFRP